MLKKLSWEGRMALTKEEKAAADEFYKQGFRLLRSFLKEQGFSTWGTSDFLRINELDVIEYIGIQKDMNGRKLLTVNVAILPLFSPSESFHISFGKRLPEFADEHCNLWYDYLAPEAATHTFQEIQENLAQWVFPWFLSLCSPAAVDKILHYPDCIYWALKQNRPDWLSRANTQYEEYLSGHQLTFAQALTCTSGGTDKKARAVQRLREESERMGAAEFIALRERETAVLFKLPKKLQNRYQ